MLSAIELNGSLQDLAGTARRRVIAYLAVGIGLTLVYAFLRGTPWNGSATLHTVMEAVATLLALVVGAWQQDLYLGLLVFLLPAWTATALWGQCRGRRWAMLSKLIAGCS